MEEGDLLVLRVTIGVSFAFLPLILSDVLQTVRTDRFETASPKKSP